MFVLASNSIHQNTRPINRPKVPKRESNGKKNLFFALDSHLGTGSVDGPSVLMEGAEGVEGVVALWCNPLTLQPEQSSGSGFDTW